MACGKKNYVRLVALSTFRGDLMAEGKKNA